MESLNLSRLASYPESRELQVPGQTNELPEVSVEGLYHFLFLLLFIYFYFCYYLFNIFIFIIIILYLFNYLIFFN